MVASSSARLAKCRLAIGSSTSGQRRSAGCSQEGIEDCLGAAHIWEVRDGGPDHASNGLLLCAPHHRMFDLDLFGIEPASHAVAAAPGHTPEALRITRSALDCRAALMEQALGTRWERFLKSANGASAAAG